MLLHIRENQRSSFTLLLLAGLVLLAVEAIAGSARSITNGKPELVLQTGHTEPINSVIFSPDGRWLASVSAGMREKDDNTVKLWDLTTGLEFRTLSWPVAFSPAGRWLASAGDDNTVKLWDLTTGLELRSLRGHADGVKAVAFSPNGRLLASASADNIVKVWEVDTGRELFALPTGNHVKGYVNVAFDSDGERLICLNQDHTVTIWQVATGQQTGTFTAGNRWFAELTRNGHWTLSVVSDKTSTSTRFAVELWDVTTGQRVYHQFTEGTLEPNNPTPSPDGRWLVWTDEHMSVTLWDVAKGRVGYSLPGDPNMQTNRTFSFQFSPDGKMLALGDDQKQTLRLLDPATGRELRTFEKVFTDRLSFSDDGRSIAAVHNLSIAVLDITTGQPLHTLRGYTRSSEGVAISRDGHFLAAATDDLGVKLWDLSIGRELRSLGGHAGYPPAGVGSPAAAVALSPDGRWLAWAAHENVHDAVNDFLVSEVATGRELVALKDKGFKDLDATSTAFSPDGHLLATGTFYGKMKIWETGTWREMRSFELGSITFPVKVTSVAFSPDGRRLAETTLDAVYILDAATLDSVRTIKKRIILAAAFSPDSKRLAIADYLSHTIDILEVESGRQVLSIPSGTADVKGLAFSPDGGWLATAGEDGTVRLRDTTNGRESRSFIGHRSEVNAVAFTRDGHWLMSASTDGSVRIWNPSTGAAVALLASMSSSSDWVVVTPDGLFDGSNEGAQKLVAWRIGNKLFPADRFYASNYTPGLLSRILGGERPEPGVLLDDLKLPPTVRITSPSTGSQLKPERISVSVEANDQGGGIAQVRLFQNGKLVGTRPSGSAETYQFEVQLIPGDNILKASALNKDNVESNDDQVRVVCETPSPGKPALHMLVAGVSEYEDPAFDLHFARPDAEAIGSFFERDNLFSSVNAIKLFDKDATKARIQEGLEQLAERAQPEDVILVYLAGHGVGLGEQFYFLPHDMRRETDDEAAIRKYGIPASAIGEALLRAKALKQVLILDTCESESALPLLAIMFHSRGLSSEQQKAVKILARSYGVFLIAASTKQQEAYEVQQLGHGVLTYALLSGLGEKGEPKAASEGIVTVWSLLKYVSDQVPELAEKYRHEKQYPVTSNTGMDFPLWAR